MFNPSTRLNQSITSTLTLLAVLFLLGFSPRVTANSPPDGTWKKLSPLNKPYSKLGGVAEGTSKLITLGQIYDVESNSWSSVNVPGPQTDASAKPIKLSNGQIAFLNEDADDQLRLKLYNPDTQTFVQGPRPPLEGINPAITKTANGQLVATGASKNTAGPMQPIDWQGTTLIATYDSETENWTTAQLKHPRRHAGIASLSDGRVMIIGGTDEETSDNALRDIEIFDPDSGSVDIIGALPRDANFSTVRATQLAGGDVLAATPVEAYRIDPETGEAEIAIQYGQPAVAESEERACGTIQRLHELAGEHIIFVFECSVGIYHKEEDQFRQLGPSVDLHRNAGSVAVPPSDIYFLGGVAREGNGFSPVADVYVYQTGFGSKLGATCSSDGDCSSGHCIAGTCCSNDCNESKNEACQVKICPEGSCEYTNREAGTSCDDGDPCTMNDQCTEAGKCKGESYQCENGPCVAEASCNGDGTCSIQTLPDGESCDDGNRCTPEDQCQSGTCEGTRVPNCSSGQSAEGAGCGCASSGQKWPLIFPIGCFILVYWTGRVISTLRRKKL